MGNLQLTFLKRKNFLLIVSGLLLILVVSAAYIIIIKKDTNQNERLSPHFEDYQVLLDNNKPQEALSVLHKQEKQASGAKRDEIVGIQIPICLRIKDIECIDRIIKAYDRKNLPAASDTGFDRYNLARLYEAKGDTKSALREYKLHEAALKQQGKQQTDEEYFYVTNHINELEKSAGRP